MATKRKVAAPKAAPTTTTAPVARIGKCAEVHAYCEQYAEQHGRSPTVAEVRAECLHRVAQGGDQNISNWQQELYAWRRKRGITGRVATTGAVVAQ